MLRSGNMNFQRIIQVLRHAAYIFTTGICAYTYIDKHNNENSNMFFIYLGLPCIAQLFMKIKALDLILGFILTVLWGFLTIAFLYDEIGDVHWAPYKEPGLYIGVVCFLLSLSVIAFSLIAYSEKNSPAVVQPD